MKLNKMFYKIFLLLLVGAYFSEVGARGGGVRVSSSYIPQEEKDSWFMQLNLEKLPTVSYFIINNYTSGPLMLLCMFLPVGKKISDQEANEWIRQVRTGYAVEPPPSWGAKFELNGLMVPSGETVFQVVPEGYYLAFLADVAIDAYGLPGDVELRGTGEWIQMPLSPFASRAWYAAGSQPKDNRPIYGIPGDGMWEYARFEPYLMRFMVEDAEGNAWEASDPQCPPFAGVLSIGYLTWECQVNSERERLAQEKKEIAKQKAEAKAAKRNKIPRGGISFNVLLSGIGKEPDSIILAKTIAVNIAFMVVTMVIPTPAFPGIGAILGAIGRAVAAVVKPVTVAVKVAAAGAKGAIQGAAKGTLQVVFKTGSTVAQTAGKSTSLAAKSSSILKASAREAGKAFGSKLKQEVGSGVLKNWVKSGVKAAEKKAAQEKWLQVRLAKDAAKEAAAKAAEKSAENFADDLIRMTAWVKPFNSANQAFIKQGTQVFRNEITAVKSAVTSVKSAAKSVTSAIKAAPSEIRELASAPVGLEKAIVKAVVKKGVQAVIKGVKRIVEEPTVVAKEVAKALWKKVPQKSIFSWADAIDLLNPTNIYGMLPFFEDPSTIPKMFKAMPEMFKQFGKNPGEVTLAMLKGFSINNETRLKTPAGKNLDCYYKLAFTVDTFARPPALSVYNATGRDLDDVWLNRILMKSETATTDRYEFIPMDNGEVLSFNREEASMWGIRPPSLSAVFAYGKDPKKPDFAFQLPTFGEPNRYALLVDNGDGVEPWFTGADDFKAIVKGGIKYLYVFNATCSDAEFTIGDVEYILPAGQAQTYWFLEGTKFSCKFSTVI